MNSEFSAEATHLGHNCYGFLVRTAVTQKVDGHFLSPEKQLLLFHRWCGARRLFCGMNFKKGNRAFRTHLPMGKRKTILDSSEERWIGKKPFVPSTREKEQAVTIEPLNFALF